MKNSVLEYVERPVVQQSSMKTIDEIELPILYVCQSSQYDYTQSRQYGYLTYTDFIMGQLDNNNLTWTGKHGNSSYEMLENILLKVNFTSYDFRTENNVGVWKQAAHESVYTVPLGHCKKLNMTTDIMLVTTELPTNFILVDPRKDNKLRVPKMDSGSGNFGPISNNTFDGCSFELEISLHDSRIHDGITCIDYKKKGNSYGECIETKFYNYLVNAYSCLPPWFPESSNLTCEEQTAIKTIYEYPYGELNHVISRFISNNRMQLFEDCLPPCVLMHMKLLETQRLSLKAGNAVAEFKILEIIKVSTDVYAYDMFSLVVDLGSALGLWLGLSALSIFDLVVDSYKTAKHVIPMVSKKE